MYNDKENNIDATQNNGNMPVENENTVVEESVEVPKTVDGPTNPVENGSENGQTNPLEMEPKVTNTNVYHEPWQQPVYREPNAPGQASFSPGIHSGAFNVHQKTPTDIPEQEKKSKQGLGFLKVVSIVLVCAMVSAAASYGVIQYSISNGDLQSVNQVVLGNDTAQSNTDETPAATTGSVASADGTSSNGVMSAESIYNMAVNQVVGVNSEGNTNVFGQTSTSAVSGSGFIISNDGYIMTNYHVISYAVEQGYTLTVMMHNGESYAATVIGYEQDNDLAVIKIEATGLAAATVGDNDTMQVGEMIYAVGNPLGELDYTMTSGIVSALDRIIQVDETTSINMFQIDAAVNPGNSGGPVYNDKGEVIGIVSAKYSSSGVEGLGFAIPINDAVSIATELISTGYVTGKASMGVSVKTVSSQAAEYYDLVEGAYVATVTPGSAADKAGIKVEDIIVKLGDTDVASKEDLIIAKKGFKAGDTTTIVVNRGGTEMSLTITFDEEGITSTASETTTQPDVSLPVQPERNAA